MNNLLSASFASVMQYIGYVLIAILVLLVMITVHEFGHYLAGKALGFGVEEFAIGFGPKLFSKKKKDGEVFSVRLLPVGGFCAFLGEGEETGNPKAFNNKKPWQRIIVLVAGALMNYILALALIFLMFGVYGQPALVTCYLDEDTEYSSEYSFQTNDVILSANGKDVFIVSDLMNAVQDKSRGDLVGFTVLRGGKAVNVNIMLRADTSFENLEDYKLLYSSLGISYETDASTGEMTNGGLYSTSVKLGFFQTIGHGVEYSFKLAGTIFTVIGQLLTGRLGISSLGGTVTTISVTASAISIGGFRYLLNIASLIGVNLAVFNLLPIPALDGAHVVFTVIEWIRKKPVNRKVEAVIHAIGLAAILIFAVFIDLQQCF